MPIQVDADIPAGNIVVESIDGDTLRLRQDLRDTEGHWFYWHCRVRGAGGRTLRVELLDKCLLATRGPAASFDGGETWRWLGADAVVEDDERCVFAVDVPPGCDDLRLAMCIPYTAVDLDATLAGLGEGAAIVRDTLTRSRQDRPVTLLRFGRTDGNHRHRVLLTARHHACEAASSYTLDGLLRYVAGSDEEAAAWLRERVAFAAMPFVDTDGVEAGDQGKNRRPHDHNRDYADDVEQLYPEVAAIKAMVHGWGAADAPTLCLDLHCPFIKGGMNNWLYGVGGPGEHHFDRLSEFGACLAAIERGPIPYDPEHNLPFGQGWNTGANHQGPAQSCASWLYSQPGVHLAATFEVPYDDASGVEVNAASARLLGAGFARAIARYLQGLGQKRRAWINR